jgi:hypothetical protein
MFPDRHLEEINLKAHTLPELDDRELCLAAWKYYTNISNMTDEDAAWVMRHDQLADPISQEQLGAQ